MCLKKSAIIFGEGCTPNDENLVKMISVLML